jgi:TolB protein
MAKTVATAALLLLVGLPAPEARAQGSPVAQAPSVADQAPIFVDVWDYNNAKTGWNIWMISPSGETRVVAATDASETYPFRFPGERAVGFLVERKNIETRNLLKYDVATGTTTDLGVTLKAGTICDAAPDGKRLACADDTGDTRQLFVIDTATGGRRQITQSRSNNSLDPSWSPDGKTIAYFTGPEDDQVGGEAKPEGDHLVALDVESGKSRLLTKVPKSREQTPRWSPDGSWIAFHRAAKQRGAWHIWLIRPDGTGETELTTGKLEHTYPTWSPDGKQIAFQCYQPDPDAFDICVVDVETRAVRQLTQTPKVDERHPVWSR